MRQYEVETVFQTPDREKEAVDLLVETWRHVIVQVIQGIVQCNTPSPISASPILGVTTGGRGCSQKSLLKIGQPATMDLG